MTGGTCPCTGVLVGSRHRGRTQRTRPVGSDLKRGSANKPCWTEAPAQRGPQGVAGGPPQLAAWAQMNLPEGFAVFGLPEAHRVRMRTTKGLERLNKELKRRTRVATPDELPARQAPTASPAAFCGSGCRGGRNPCRIQRRAGAGPPGHRGRLIQGCPCLRERAVHCQAGVL